MGLSDEEVGDDECEGPPSTRNVYIGQFTEATATEHIGRSEEEEEDEYSVVTGDDNRDRGARLRERSPERPFRPRQPHRRDNEPKGKGKGKGRGSTTPNWGGCTRVL